ncbi:MAG: ribosome small subunit-dependent GTPase A [Saprospiraceae bacterium]|nr:ribosome small subunit-dependent GTPase A [Saprospiraceae bacterium]
MKGVVIKSTGSWYQVRLIEEDLSSRIIQCRTVGKLRLDDLKLTNPVAVGDEVEVNLNEANNEGTIKTVYTRKNYILRQSTHKKHDMHLMASNIDQVLLITTIVEPNLKIGFVDRFLLLTEPRDIPTTIIINKVDLIKHEKDVLLLDTITTAYRQMGYDVIHTSVVSQDGLEHLKAAMHNKISMISGHSGVGKSSLVNMIQPNLDIRVGDISNYSGKGQHTTTFAEMHDLDFGGKIIDTPGIKSLAFNNMEIMDVAHNFRDFFAISQQCRFGGNCTHRNEPKCAVKEGVVEGEIPEWRYQNYLQIVDEIENQNYWEIHKD